MSLRSYSKWNQYERNTLLELVSQFRRNRCLIDWEAISSQIQTKTTRQCYDQYNILAKQHQNKDKRHLWSKQEEQLLLKLFDDAPYQWECIQVEFKNISINQLKNKFNYLKNKSQKSEL
ncbi:Myb-like_DNA-binding domain-containing protein [Hexamita inflata]|uniref:Myb-like DNA-binding domain-containing protein n=1 Tax=Hexamita inflata TaxID=28002 RepID=A0AA86RDL0_9EUKA|nr:Myb-like DNA-binding domain-containing protein [Hexamita inflata]